MDEFICNLLWVKFDLVVEPDALVGRVVRFFTT